MVPSPGISSHFFFWNFIFLLIYYINVQLQRIQLKNIETKFVDYNINIAKLMRYFSDNISWIKTKTTKIELFHISPCTLIE